MEYGRLLRRPVLSVSACRHWHNWHSR